LYVLNPPCRRSACSFTGGRFGVGGVGGGGGVGSVGGGGGGGGGGGVDVEARDSSSELPFSSSPCASSITSRKQAGMSA